jgi:iron complex outermembrane receptor protein
MELARLTFKSITAYRSLKTHAFDSDQDGTPYDLGVILYRGDRQHQFSQEFQAYGAALNDRLNWISGLHYLVEGATFDQQFRIFVPPTSSWSENQPSGNARNDSLAAYGQVTYALTPTLRITAGARYNEDARQLTSRNARRVGAATFCTLSPALRDQTGLCQATLPERKFRYLPWTVGFDFKPVEQAMLYAKLSRGYRAGGYNVRGTTQVDLATFDPERVTEVEVGAKAELFSHRLRLNLALFRSLFDNIQLSQREMTAPGIPGTAFIANGGEAKVEGAELEVTALLGRLRLGGSVGILHPAFTKLNPNVVGVTLDSKFRNTPESNASLVADLPILTGFAEVNLHADYSWRDNMSFSYDPTSPARQAAYGLLNAMVSIRFDRADLELALWARNLADRRYITYAFENGFYISATPGDPRTFGASLAYRFGAE